MGMSDYLEEKLLNEVLRNVGYTPAATVYLSLHTADPGDTGAGEVAGGAYARQALSFAAAVNPGGTCTTNADVTFPTATLDWGTITHFGVWDAAAAGNFLLSGALDLARMVENGDVFKITSGSLTVQFS